MTEIAELDRKMLVLLKGENRPLAAILDPRMVTPDGKFIRLGEFYSDEISGYYPLDEILGMIISVVKEFP